MQNRTAPQLLAVTACLGAAAAWAQQSPPEQEGPILPASQPAAVQPTPRAGRLPAQLSIPELIAAARGAIGREDFIVARALLDEVFRREEQNPQAALLDAELAIKQGDVDRARQRYLMVRRVQPNDFEANMGLARIYVDSEMYRQAEGYLQIAEAVAPPDRLGELLTLLAQTHRGNGRLAQALQTAERAVQADPDNLQARHMLVNLRTEAQQFDAALLDSKTLVDLAKRQVRESPGDVEKVRELYAAYEARLNVWRALHQTLYVMNPDGTRSDELIPGREAQAAETIRQIVDLLTYQAELRLILAQYEMITFAEKAVAYAPDNPDVLLQLALLLENTSQLDRARAVYQRVLELDRENEQARRRLHALGGTPTAAAASQPTQQ